MFEFNVGQSGSIDQNTSLGLIEHPFNDDAAAVLFKSTPLDPRLGADATVFYRKAERDAFSGLHAQGDVLQFA